MHTSDLQHSLNAKLSDMRSAVSRSPCPDWAWRRQRLDTVKQLLNTHADAIAESINQDFGGRPPSETRLLELFPSLSSLQHAAAHGKRWMRGRRHWANQWFLPARTRLLPRPKGVVGIVVPWNYPLYLAVGPLVDALTAGNRVMLKMSEHTPRFSALFADLVAQHFAADEVHVVTGDADVGKAFAALPFDHLLFTGSTDVGRKVMQAASANLTPVTLELGGKSPALVAPGARLDHAVERILFGKSVNAGQTCIAPDYVLVPRAEQAAFIAEARDQFQRLYPPDTQRRDYAALHSDAHAQRMHSLQEQAEAAGSTAYPLAEADPARRCLPPVLLTDVHSDSPVMQEEIFGPLLPLVAYDDLDEALAFVAARPHPLAFYLFDDDAQRRERLLPRIHAGGIAINDTLFHIAQHHLPFGGVGSSGMGAYHGEAGFKTFSHMQSVFLQSRFNLVGLMNPPYGSRFRKMLRYMMR
ncbi:MAG: coniferyl aldehyde dehydrogenase [Rhodanobacteraceae bacterium]